MIPDLSSVAFSVSTWIFPVLVAVVLHELAHGVVADRMGDPTARLAGRLSLNPIRHIDPVGTIFLPGFLLLISSPFMLGWAKPVPVNSYNLPRPRQSMAVVAAAGPATNFVLAFMALIALSQISPSLGSQQLIEWLSTTLWNTVFFNLVLGVFNLLPVPPLDGGRIITGLVPESVAMRLDRMEPFGMLLLVGGLFLLPFIGSKIGIDLDGLSQFIMKIVRSVLDLMITVINAITLPH